MYTWRVRVPGGSKFHLSPGKIGVRGGGDLIILPLEHSHTVHCERYHYVPVSGGREASGVMGSQ